MPLYEYYCDHCAKPFEALRSMSQADNPIDCPRCAHAASRRVISRFAAVSKDGGSSRMVASSTGGGGCGSCAGGHCSTCGH